MLTATPFDKRDLVMESSPPQASRRRLTRTVLGQDESNSLSSSSQAGPSRLPQLVDVDFNELDKSYDEGDSDDHSTPKIPSSSKLPLSNGETPAARLRALLSLVPNHPPSTLAPPPPESVTEHDSDFDKGESMNATASVARESLRDIFSRALRAPGDTPQKMRRRRNSIDVSEVDASPRLEKERARNKGKRKSLSDEEVENPSRVPTQPHASFKSRSQPLTLDVLRHRFMNARSQSQDLQPPSPTKQDTSEDTADILRELNSSRASPPAATSTPQHSLRMSIDSQYQMQSNLLDQDSEMQRAIEGLDSYEEQLPVDIVPSQEVTFPGYSEETIHNRSNSARRRASGASQKHLDYQPADNTVQTDVSPSSSSSRSGVSPPKTDDQIRKPERLWNSSAQPLNPKVKHESSTNRLSRDGLANGTQLFPHRNETITSPRLSDASSQSSSVGSQAEYRERIRTLDWDHRQERERDWNKPHPHLSRTTSSLSLRSPQTSQRFRTQSFNSQNTSTISTGLRRQHSYTSSVGSSPTGSSHASHDEEPVPEVVHERERNWNSPRPVWHDHVLPKHSPLPGVPSQNIPKISTPQHSHPRVRTQSLSSVETNSDEPSILPSMSTKSKSLHSRPPDQLSRTRSALTPESSHSPQTHLSPHASGNLSIRSISPLPSPSTKRRNAPSIAGTNLGHISSNDAKRNRISQPIPSASQNSSRRSPLHSPSKSLSTIYPSRDNSTIRASTSQRSSRVPVVSPKGSKVSNGAHSTGHNILQNYSGIEHDMPSGSSSDLEIGGQRENGSNTHLDGSADSRLYPLMSGNKGLQPQELTPTQKTIAPPSVASPRQPTSSPLSPPLKADDTNHPSSGLSYVSLTGDSPHQPAPTTDASQPDTSSFLSTPPHRSTFNTPKADFQTPLPPRELPELPGPPSTDGDSEDETQWSNPPQTRLFVKVHVTPSAKTPKPPGGWTNTPAPSRRTRAYSDSMHVRSSGLEALQTGLPPYRSDARDESKWMAMQTPKPPGGWLSTPVHLKVQHIDQSVETDTEPEVEGEADPRVAGFATPASSLSKGSHLNMQTPPAPAARKGVLKVRFDSQASQTQEFGETDESLFEHHSNGRVGNSVDSNPRERRPQQGSHPSTSETLTSVSPTRSPRKAPSIRILDAFGNEQHNQVVRSEGSFKQTPRGDSTSIIHALGQSRIEGESTPLSDTSDVPIISGNRDELLSRVRRGLNELVEEIQEIDRTDTPALDMCKMQELDVVSRNARESRRILSQQLQSSNNDPKEKLGPLRATIRRSKSLIPASVPQFSKFQVAPSLFLAFLFFQIVLVVVMYRVSTALAKDMFLTTYYDPFYPDLYLYSSKSQIFGPSSPTLTSSWFSVLGLFRQHGWKHFVTISWRNLPIILAELQTRIWDAWGVDVITQAKTWPPT